MKGRFFNMTKQLFETYKKEDDVFYTDVAGYTQMPEKELEEYESIYLDLPKELSRIIQDKCDFFYCLENIVKYY